jgi:hypothetical protein
VLGSDDGPGKDDLKDLQDGTRDCDKGKVYILEAITDANAIHAVVVQHPAAVAILKLKDFFSSPSTSFSRSVRLARVWLMRHHHNVPQVRVRPRTLVWSAWYRHS